MALKWGVAGAGKISHDFVTATQTYPETNHVFTAVAAKSKARAEKFAEDHGIPNSYEGYLKLAQDKNVDIVYVANLNNQHFETVKLMLDYGKHVLCEKPFTMNEKQTKRLYQIAQDKNLLVMEGIWSRSFPVYKEMKKLIDEGLIGEVMQTTVNFGFPLQYDNTTASRGGGSILDLGIYMLQFQQYVFRGLKPIKIAVTGHLTEFGTDESCAAITTYLDGKLAVVSTSARVKLENEGIVTGTKGTLRLPDFWCPDKLVMPDGSVKVYPLPTSAVPFLLHNSAGLCYQAEEARLCIKQGNIECPHITHAESIELARLMDYLRKEMNVVFPEDSQEF